MVQHDNIDDWGVPAYIPNVTSAITTDAQYVVEDGEADINPWYQLDHELTLKHCGSMYMERVSAFRRDHCDITTCRSQSEQCDIRPP
jgi:hypothetical protein